MKHEIEITRVIALLDEVLLVIFEDKTLHVHDVELHPEPSAGISSHFPSRRRCRQYRRIGSDVSLRGVKRLTVLPAATQKKPLR